MDPTQLDLLKEKCLLVDEKDRLVGTASKHDCHFVHPNGDIKLHRAFSVFLFNSRGEMLIQKRAPTKITYPNRYTNTCCSHPIANIQGEDEEKDALGIKRAAQRRLNYELGIPIQEIPLESLKYVAKIYYKDQGDGNYGEHEIDYVIFVQKDVTLKLNFNEVSEVRYLNQENLKQFLENKDVKLTPWFELILKHKYLKQWWNSLNNLDQFKEYENILTLKF